MQQAGQLGTEKAGLMRTAKKFHATRKHQRMRRPCCQGSESAYPFQSNAAKTTKPKASADTSSTLPEFEMWRSIGTRPSSPGSVKLGVTTDAYLNTLLILSQMLRSPAPVSAVISLKIFMCASVAGPAIPSATSPFFC